jgi:hypothetical protein
MVEATESSAYLLIPLLTRRLPHGTTCALTAA